MVQESILEARRTPEQEEKGENSFLDSPAYEKEVDNIPAPPDPPLLRSLEFTNSQYLWNLI